jgi:hypothetical protein
MKSRANNFVSALFTKRFGITLTPITEANPKTPDFEFCLSNNRIFVCEVKEFEYYTLGPPDGEIHSRIDNGPARVGRDIKKAYAQLKQYECLKVLALLCNTPFLDVKDLEEAFNGYMIYGNQHFSYINEVSKKIAEGDIKEIKKDIDLYIWIDAFQKSIDKAKVFFRYPSQTGFSLSQKYFANPKSK